MELQSGAKIKANAGAQSTNITYAGSERVNGFSNGSTCLGFN